MVLGRVASYWEYAMDSRRLRLKEIRVKRNESQHRKDYADVSQPDTDTPCRSSVLEKPPALQVIENICVAADKTEKRQIQGFARSNSVWKDGQIYPKYREPFDTIALMGMRDETKQAVSTNENGLRLVGRGFIASFRNLCLDPPVEVIRIFNEFDRLRNLLVSV
jgi:hypothetical protein